MEWWNQDHAKLERPSRTGAKDTGELHAPQRYGGGIDTPLATFTMILSPFPGFRAGLQHLLAGRKKRGGARTGRLVGVFALNLQWQHQLPQTESPSRHRVQLTAAEVFCSWLDLPVTLKATPLGAVSLNSKVVADRW